MLSLPVALLGTKLICNSRILLSFLIHIRTKIAEEHWLERKQPKILLINLSFFYRHWLEIQ